jgi:hypothetical protein
MTKRDHSLHFIGGPMDGAAITVNEVPKELVISPSEVPVSIMVLFRAHRYVCGGKKTGRLTYKEPVVTVK